MLIHGKNALIEAIRNRRPIYKVYLHHDLKDQNLVKLLMEQSIKIEMGDQKTWQQRFNTTERIVSEVEDYRYCTLDEVVKKRDEGGQVLVMLDGLEDPHNLGAIIRSVDASGANGIIIPKNRSVGITSSVVKVSTGAIEYVDIIEVTNLVTTIKELKKRNYWIIGLEIDGDEHLYSQDYSGSIVLVIGSEGKGISRLVKEQCDFLVKIPMYGLVNSLNASVSAGILLYQVAKARRG